MLIFNLSARTAIFYSILLSLLVFCLTSPFLPAGTDLEVEHRARAIQPGEVLVLKVTSGEELDLVIATVGDHQFPFFQTAPNQWLGLLGVDLSTKAGLSDIQIEGKGRNGNTTRSQYSIQVEDKEFPVRRLTVDSKYVSPPEEVLSRIQKEQEMVSRIFSSLTADRYWDGPFIRPVPGEVISSFGKRSILNGVPRSPHSGTDFRAGNGTPIQCPNYGKVVLVKDLYYSGNTVIVDHGLGLYSYFAHLSKFDVNEGESVAKGQVIGEVGSTGRVTGPHLHWTVRLAGTRVDPVSLMQVLSDLIW